VRGRRGGRKRGRKGGREGRHIDTDFFGDLADEWVKGLECCLLGGELGIDVVDRVKILKKEGGREGGEGCQETDSKPKFHL